MMGCRLGASSVQKYYTSRIS